jgi:ribosome-binding factor A
MSRRTERIGEQLRGEIARVLREDVTDPRVRLVTLTRLDVAPDLSSALVFWSCVGASEPVAAGLDSAASFVRGRLAKVLPLRRVPELLFRYDPSFDLADRTLAVLRDVAPHGAPDEESDGPA